MSVPRPGSFGLSRIGGTLGTAVHVGQALLGDSSIFTHAFMVLDKGEIIQAEPSGAAIYPLSMYTDRSYGGPVAFCDYPVLDEVKRHGLSQVARDGYEQILRAAVVREARALEGTPYSFLDYVVLALQRFGFEPAPVLKRMEQTGEMICSQMVDEAYRRAGVHLFDDGRKPQSVTPGDLARYHGEHPALIL